jgi:hypothetical protein
MATVWYCCQCGNGPMGTSNNSSCSESHCFHSRCVDCSVVQQEYVALQSGCESQNHTAPSIIQSTDLTTVLFIGSGGHAYICLKHGHGEPTDGRDFRWTCRECFADNNYNHDAACWDCQHWRCDSCNVYEVIRK